MHKSEMDRLISLAEACRLISVNPPPRFIWFGVRTKAGCVVELGGTKDEVKVDICIEQNGEIVTYENGYTPHSFSLHFYLDDCYCRLETVDANNRCEKFKSLEEFLSYIDNTKGLNRVEIKKKPVYATVFDHWNLDWEIGK